MDALTTSESDPRIARIRGSFLSAAQTRTIVRFSQLADPEYHSILFPIFLVDMVAMIAYI